MRALIDGADLAAVVATMREGEQRVANLERLVERAHAFENEGGDLRGFVGRLRQIAAPGMLGAEAHAAQAQVVDERDDVVRVMTVHQAKGLEFPVVFVPACGGKEPVEYGVIRYDAGEGLGLRVHDERAPAAWLHTAASRRVHEARLQRRRAESLRLFYVAATRAKDLVVFSGELVRGAGDSWRAQLDAITDRTLLPHIDGDAAGRATARRKDGVQFSLFADGGAERALAQVASRPPPRPLELTAAVTQLADFELCPRRYLHFHALGLAEHPAAARAASVEVALDTGVRAARSAPARHAGPPAARTLPLRRADRSRRVVARRRLRSRTSRRCRRCESTCVVFSTASSRATFGRTGGAGASSPFLLAVPLEGGGRLFVRGQIDLLILDAARA